MKIVEVTNKQMLKDFIVFPIKMYHECSNYIPGIIKDDMENFMIDKNPAFDFCESKQWLAYDDFGNIIGRIAAIINYESIEKFGEKRGRFGYIDSIDQIEIFEGLFEVAENWLKEKGMSIIQGPLGFSDLDEEGMLIEGFNEKGTMTTIYNYSYYPDNLKLLGYEIDAVWYEYELMIPKSIDSKIAKLSENVLQKYDLKILKAKSSKGFEPYIHDIFDLINISYKDLYNITTLTERQMEYYKKKYFSFIHPDFVKLILDRDNKVIAFGIGFPSLSKALNKAKGKLFPIGIFYILKAFKFNDRVELALIAVDPKYQRKGIPAILFNEIFKSLIKNKIQLADLNPQLEDNTAVRSHWKNFDIRQHKKRASFRKKL
ncbi:MAG: GNAT family N-acetyltransferase [Clostridiales bacterium]|nr:GNAT family N-acetyltransferase [Clostridiales bacterium]